MKTWKTFGVKSSSSDSSEFTPSSSGEGDVPAGTETIMLAGEALKLMERLPAEPMERPSPELMERPSAELTERPSAELTERPSAELTERPSAELTERASAELTERLSAELMERLLAEPMERLPASARCPRVLAIDPAEAREVGTSTRHTSITAAPKKFSLQKKKMVVFSTHNAIYFKKAGITRSRFPRIPTSLW
ncbi:hypothetical protein BV898_01764 [Hypsibius exemplaris]|uniref:Uncharacterized protein n=1 Tax=Hypsibius exemplaris TaxID=2072580 RepID=A0A1W0X9Y9_HYPEX|nr:hypothetical protein BV898_01764 [Hypsibius exemplaris]